MELAEECVPDGSRADDGCPLLYMTLIAVSRQFGGGSSSGLVALLCSRSTFFSTLLAECLIISALTPLTSATIFSVGWWRC